MHVTRLLASTALVAGTALIAPAAASPAPDQAVPPGISASDPAAHTVPPTALKQTTTQTQAQVDRSIAEANAAGAVALDIDFQYQETGYWCGPASTRIALSAQGVNVSQQQMANELPTTENGTDWIGQVTQVLNNHLGAGYVTREMPNDPPTQDQKDLLWNDIVHDIDNGYAVVTNIVAPAGNHPPGYPDYTIYHYFTVIGYNADTGEVLIADPAGFADTPTYWLTFDKLASLVPPKGYSA